MPIPPLIIDGEMMADEALNPDLIEELYPFSSLKGGANVLILPDLASANIAGKFAARVGGGELIGPILMGDEPPGACMATHGDPSIRNGLGY